jgi:hypothetical protein
MNSLLGPRYRFFVRKNPYGARHQEGLFINIPNFLFVLKAHYTDFAKIGGEFDYEQVLNEFENEDSLFWDKVCKSDFLMGLLFGYGAKNAFAFVWRSKYNLQLPIIFGKHQGWDPVYQQNISIKDLPLPRLCAYSLGDETIEKYLKERKQIIKAFKGRSFEETVYEWLSAGR